MSVSTYTPSRSPGDRPLVWLRGEVKSPPFSPVAHIEAGVLLRRLQRGERLGMPHSRPMPRIGPRCHELRIPDAGVAWRIIYRADSDAIVIGDVFAKKTARTPASVFDGCARRFHAYDSLVEVREEKP